MHGSSHEPMLHNKVRPLRQGATRACALPPMQFACTPKREARDPCATIITACEGGDAYQYVALARRRKGGGCAGVWGREEVKSTLGLRSPDPELPPAQHCKKG